MYIISQENLISLKQKHGILGVNSSSCFDFNSTKRGMWSVSTVNFVNPIKKCINFLQLQVMSRASLSTYTYFCSEILKHKLQVSSHIFAFIEVLPLGHSKKNLLIPLSAYKDCNESVLVQNSINLLGVFISDAKGYNMNVSFGIYQ